LNHGANLQLLNPTSRFQIAIAYWLAFPFRVGHALYVRFLQPNLLITLLI
jgi:hypothetical protein